MNVRLTVCAVVMCACHEPSVIAPPAAAEDKLPVRVERPVAESELATVRFSRAATQHLALQTAQVAGESTQRTRLSSGEVIVPPGRALTVAAPVGGSLRASQRPALKPGSAVNHGDVLFWLTPFAPVDRDVKARAEREVAATTAQLKAAEARVSRLSQLGADKAISRRVVEEAVAARDTVRADVEAAEKRALSTREAPLWSDAVITVRAPGRGVVRGLWAVPGQDVAAGAPLVEIVALDALEVRVSVYSGDIAHVDETSPAQVRSLSALAADGVTALAIAGPPTASPDRTLVDRYYALPDGTRFAPGERVLVELPLRQQKGVLTLPRAAVVYDALGAAWVYVCAGDGAFRRTRIDPLQVAGEKIQFQRGPALGSCVASVGAADIFGAEFPPGH